MLSFFLFELFFYGSVTLFWGKLAEIVGGFFLHVERFAVLQQY
jgi:hypothetical protein